MSLFSGPGAVPRLLATLSVGMLTSGSALQAQKPAAHNELWYTKPSPIWTAALPVGNGRLGAMVFGGANASSNNGDQEDVAKNAGIADGHLTRGQDEHLQLNESSIWEGSRADLLNPRAHEGFVQVRELLLASKGTDAAKISEAEKLAQETLISTPRGMPGYSTLGDLYLRMQGQESVSEYRRSLDLNTGVARVTYTVGGTLFTREVFASAPDNVVVMHLAADKPASLSFALSMDRPADFSVAALDDHDLALTPGPQHKEQIRFQGQARLIAQGGAVHREGNTLVVSQANEVTILIAAVTDFKGGPLAGGDPAQSCEQVLRAAETKGYASLRSAATADEQRWMGRMSLSLGSPDAALQALPTDERLRRVSAGADDFGLQALYFSFARYLLVGSSRPGGLPGNLQGLWASGIGNPWGSKWTININTEMNYWIAEPANLGELHQPLFDLLDMVRTPATGTGQQVARKYYGADGFVIHHNTDIWGDAHPIDGVPYGIWPMGGAWLTLHAWDHYAFSGDEQFLRERAWPLLHEASTFFLSYLVDDGNGHLVTGPSLSPENKYKMADGSAHSLTMGPTMDIEIVRELLERTLDAGAVLHEDSAFLTRVKTAMDRLPPFKVGHRGNLQEWQVDYDDAAEGHRHISHLWALFPGTQITPQHTPGLARAAQASLQDRLDHGGGQTGWSRAWVVNYWDHLRNGAQAYDSLQVLFRQSTFPNLMDTHPPGVFQIDGNLGAANGMVDALVQSRWYLDRAEVDLLPALPPAWKEGALRGVRVRGGAEVNLSWAAGRLHEASFAAKRDVTLAVRVPAGEAVRVVRVDGQKDVPMQADSDGAVRVVAAKGHTYSLVFQQ